MTPPPSRRHFPTPTQRNTAREAAVVARIRECGIRRGVLVVDAEAKIGVERIGRDDLPRVHAILGIEQRLHLPERARDLGPEHLRKQLTARLSIAVLTGERAVVRDDQIGRPLDELAKPCDAGCGAHIEWDPRVHATLSEVTVERRLPVAELIEQRAEITEVGGETVGRDRGVLPARPGVRQAGDASRRAER